MHKSNKMWFGIVMTAIIVVTIGFSFYWYLYKRDFTKYNFVACDPTQYSCFVTECSEDDPRCVPYMDEEGMYSFAITYVNGNSEAITEYCSDSTLEQYSFLLFDAVCSE